MNGMADVDIGLISQNPYKNEKMSNADHSSALLMKN